MNITLLSLYAVQVFTPHHECLTRGGRNITDNFELAFLLGFIILAADFINSSFMTIYYRYKVQQEERYYSFASSFTQWMQKGTITSEYGFRITMTIIAIYQFTVVHSKFGTYCVSQLGVLNLEGRWIYALIAIHFIKCALLTIWEFTSIYAAKDYEDQAYNVMSSDSESIGELSKKSARSHKELIYAKDKERQYINKYLNK